MRTDLQLNNDGGIRIADNDCVLAESDAQHIQDTINASPGWWKQYPADGVAIFDYLNSDGKEQEIARKCILNLNADNYFINYPAISKANTGEYNISITLQ